jgi:F0F1-type ATP synthase assembly protein I
VLGGAAVGWWIDSRLASEPIGIVSGVVLGSILGLTQFLRMVSKLTHEEGAGTTQER